MPSGESDHRAPRSQHHGTAVDFDPLPTDSFRFRDDPELETGVSAVDLADIVMADMEKPPEVRDE